MLGKKPPKHDRRTLLMASYLVPMKLPNVPARVWTNALGPDFGMMANDVLGDCTCAAMAHMIQIWTGNASTEVTIPDAQVVQAYRDFCGYQDTPETDNGGVELDVLNGWRKTGIGGHRIEAFVALEPSNRLHMKAAIAHFGGAYVGLALPATAQDQRVWSVVPHAPSSVAGKGTWGGHAVCCVGYDQHFVWCVTWGKVQRMTWDFVSAYMDEAYCVLSKDWFAPGKDSSLIGATPEGFDMAALVHDLAAL